MKEKFTPGPWEADCDCFPIMVRAEKMDPDCHQDWVCNVGGDRANARLIAAAPDMYEAGKEMAEAVALLPCDDGRILGLLPILCRLRAAIAKAECAQ